MIKFNSNAEFNVIFDRFEKEHKREYWRCPQIKEGETQKWPNYKNTAKFQFCVKTFELWYLYAQNYLDRIKEISKEKYEKMLKEYEQIFEKMQEKRLKRKKYIEKTKKFI